MCHFKPEILNSSATEIEIQTKWFWDIDNAIDRAYYRVKKGPCSKMTKREFGVAGACSRLLY